MAVHGAETGFLYILLEVLCHQPLHIRDKVGYIRAKEEYRYNSLYILHLSDPYLLKRMGTRYGLSLCVVISYILAALVFSVLVVKIF